MTQPAQTIKDSINSITTRLLLIEHQLAELEKNRVDKTAEIQLIHDKIDLIKLELSKCNINSDIISSITDVEKRIRDIELELPDFRLVKKVFLGLIAVILTAFIGAVWNNIIQPPHQHDVDDVAKIIKEYREQDEQTKK